MKASTQLFARAARLSFAIFINKPIGLLRDILRVRYMGVGILADAFSTAWRIPNAFRRIFGEGALSSVLVPTIIEIEKEYGKHVVSELITLLLVVIQMFIAGMCSLIAYYAYPILICIAPGAMERASYAVPLLRILIFFILSMSSSVILGSVLQARHVFLIGPLSQFVLNIALCIEFGICAYFSYSLVILSWMLLGNGIIIFLMHWYTYRSYGFKFFLPSRAAVQGACLFLKRFFPALLGAGIVEINLFVDQAIASYLPAGSQSMFEYISAFIRLPLQVFGSSFATVSSSHFAEIAQKNPSRLSFYLFESLKMMFWFCLNATIAILLFSYHGLYTLLLSEKFTLVHVEQGAFLMRIFAGIVFFSTINRTFVNVYYAFHLTSLPTSISVFTTILNSCLTYVGMRLWGLPGIVGATVLVEAVRSLLLLYFLQRKATIIFIWEKWIRFCFRCLFQVALVGSMGASLYGVVWWCIRSTSGSFQYYALQTFLSWVWIGPVLLMTAYALLKTRKMFGIKLYYLP